MAEIFQVTPIIAQKDKNQEPYNECLSLTLYIHVFFANCKQIIFQR